MQRLWAAMTGRQGIGPWLGLHLVAYLVLFTGWLAVILAVYEGDLGEGVRGIPLLLVWGLGPFAPFLVLVTAALTAVAWAFRELSPVTFRVLVLVGCVLPLVCLLGPEPIALMAPIQVLYGSLIRRPRWVHPLDRTDGD